MTSIPNLSGSFVAANNQNIAGLVNINLDVSLVRCSPPEEFSTIGPALSLHRRQEAEGGQQHKLACRLGFLFNDIIPATPKLIKAFGIRVSDILRRPGVNPQGSNEDGPFRDFVGADGTSIWAAATSMSASLSVYLLACMLARAWDAKQATAIWVELVHERKLQVQAQLEQNSIVNPYTHIAAMQDFNRPDLARWDASARSWLRRADQCTVFQHTQFKLVIDNIRLPFLDSGTTFDKVTRAWIGSMEVLEILLGNEPQVAFDRSVLLAISSWHLYPNLLVFQEEATNVSFSDDLFPALGVLSLGFEYHAPRRDVHNKKTRDTGLGMATRWSLALSHLRYYGSPVQVKSEEIQRERATVDEMWLTCLGAILRQWEVSISNLDVSVQWFQKIGDLLHPIEESEKTVLSWLSQLCRAASSISNQNHTKRPDRMRLVMFGWRKDTQLLGYQKVLRPPFFGLCNPDVLGSLSKKDGTEIGFEFFRTVAQRLNLSPDHAIICRSKEDDNLNEAYEWATISPVQAGLDGPRQLDEDDPSLPRNARWLYAEDREGRTIRSIGLQQRQTSIHRLGERCHIIHDPRLIPRKKKATWDSRDSRDSEIVPAGLRVWENPPSLYAEDGQSAQFIELLFIPMPDSSAGFHMFVRKEVYEHRLNDLKSEMNRAAMEVNVQESLKWLETEGSSFDIVGFLMGFVQGHQYSFLHGRGRFAGKKRKRSPIIDADAKGHHAGLLDSDNGRHLGCYYTVGLYRRIPTEWIASLRALEMVSVLYSQLPGATISLRLIDQELFKAKWFPYQFSDSEDSFSKVANTSTQDLCKEMTRAQSFACIAMMESGQSNIDIEHTEAVVALCSDNSIFVAGILLSDPTTANLGMNIRHLVGNVGHAGIVLMISPSEPSTRAPTYDASMIDHNLYDGKHIDSFKGTSLHLSFTKWQMPLEWDSTGDIDQQVFLLESVISVQDKGRWVADLDVLALERDGCDILQFPCDCDRSKPPTDKDIASLDSWEELLDAPPSVGVIRASDNWVARLCAAAILIRKGQAHCVVVTADEPICWAYFVGYVCEDLQPAATSIPDALAKWPNPSWLPNQTGHNLAAGTTGTFWDSLANEPARSRRFASSMSLMQRMPGWQPAAALEMFDWGALSPDAVVVDVGGGDGSFAVALAERFPKLKSIIVQDIADMVEQSRGTVPEALRGIVTPLVADFFKPQTVKGAAVYFLRKVLHDWPDEFAIRILQQLVPALKPGARILMNDHYVPPPGILSPNQEWRVRGQDLAMMALFNSKERTREQWTDLIKRADQRFVIESVTPMPPGPLALIVVVWD